MSTFGGDSWVPEALHRKQQADQVLCDVHQLDRFSDHWRRLSNGRIACLVCPRHPVLDSFPMLIIHRKGAKHQEAAAKHEEKDFRLQNEIQKRRALEAEKPTKVLPSSEKPRPSSVPACSPLLEATRKRTVQALAMSDDSENTARDLPNTKQKTGPFFSAMPSQVPTCPVNAMKTSATAATRQSKSERRKHGTREGESRVVLKEDRERRQERERLLRLREAGWRLDGNGKWFKDETVEFDSDEEAPGDLL